MHQALHIAVADGPWMTKNLILAAIPFVLAAALARAPHARELVAWGALLAIALVAMATSPLVGTKEAVAGVIGVAACGGLLAHWLLPHWLRVPIRVVGWTMVVAFLPNAPYVWTDGLHLVGDFAVTHTRLSALVVLIPLYATYTVVGFLPYLLTLLLIERRFVERGWSRWIVPLRLLQYVPVGVGIYLGRIERFNSWNPFLHWHGFAATMRIQAHDSRVWAFTALSILILAATTEVARIVLLRATSRRESPDRDHHVDLRRLVAFVAASAVYMAGAMLATAYVPAALLGTVHAPGWGTMRITAAVGVGVAIAGAAILAYRAVAMRREHMRAAWTTVGMLTLAAPYVGGCVMLMYSALNWSISGGVPRYLGPERFL